MLRGGEGGGRVPVGPFPKTVIVVINQEFSENLQNFWEIFGNLPKL